MHTYVALLRGINVGGNSKVEMSKLKKMFEDLGYTDVLTYINSGNVVFKTKEKDKRVISDAIHKALKKTFGFEIKTLIRSGDAIKKLAKTIPKEWRNDAEQKTDVLFLWEEFDTKKSIDLIDINPEIDTLKYISGSIVWNVSREQYNKSGMHKFIGTKVYKHMTARNVNTVRKLAELMK